MKPSAHFETIKELLKYVTDPSVALDHFLDRYLRERRFIGSKDRRAIIFGFYDIIRNWGVIQEVLQKILPIDAIDERARIIAYMILIRSYDRACVNAYFSDDLYGLKPLTPHEETLISKLYTHDKNAPPSTAASLNVPDWITDTTLYSDVFCQNLHLELEALNHPAPVDIRVNSTQTTLKALSQLLEHHQILAHPSPLAPHGLRLMERANLQGLKEFKQGYFEIQDEGSQLLVHLATTHSASTALDYCAGAGGKTLYLAELMHSKGRVIATDISTSRLSEAKKRAQRAGLKNIDFLTFSNFESPLSERYLRHFECVLVDAPCTGSGTWRRKPELKWRLKRDNILSLHHKQLDILHHASAFVKQGGELIYITCSLFREENEMTIERFLKDHTDFYVADAVERLSHVIKSFTSKTGGPYVRLTPYSTGTDGFFGAVLRRQK